MTSCPSVASSTLRRPGAAVPTRLAASLLLLATAWLTLPAVGETGGERCGNYQSPRVLAGFEPRPSFTIDRLPGSASTILFTQHPDERKWVLARCGQHVHCQVENVQPECGQEGASGTCGAPAPGDWVEVHTVYSTEVGTGCHPESLDCCRSRQAGDPVLVVGYHARVTAEGPPLSPFPVPWSSPTVLWSGSTTGTKDPKPCRPPAQWSFVLGCGFTVSTGQLGLFEHFDQSRPLQTLVSPDLALRPAP